ncbi:unnamed protein product [Clonostachys solani]|uniref:Uncharacterized protein n=1 Tax=Clonostachys solani TaxID=160281 RepID=A0A9N9ZIN2_9HYPO|nr:unnamed protein product [Clonostachys solani]
MTTNSFGGPLPFQVQRPMPAITRQARIAKAVPWALVATTAGAAALYVYGSQTTSGTALRSFSMAATGRNVPVEAPLSAKEEQELNDKVARSFNT